MWHNETFLILFRLILIKCFVIGSTLEKAFKKEQAVLKLAFAKEMNVAPIIPTISQEDRDDWKYREALSTLCN